jgi:hypothetical protein
MDTQLHPNVRDKVWFSFQNSTLANIQWGWFNFSSQLLHCGSDAEALYKEHRLAKELDALNILYVALTRARNQLYVVTHSVNEEGAGMGADLFGSLAGSTCALMVLTSEITDLYDNKGKDIKILPMLLPLGIYATGIFSSIIACIFGSKFFPVNSKEQIKKALQLQELIATGLSGIILIGTIYSFFGGFLDHRCTFRTIKVTWLKAYICCALGLFGGLFVGFVTEWG